MTSTYFDVRARVTECEQCGAPLFGAAGQNLQCQYCGSQNWLVARPDDGRSAPSAADEVVRLSQLKAQEANPVAGHAYDLSDVPFSVKAMGGSEETGADLDALLGLWPRMKEIAPQGLEEQRGLVWVAIHCAKLLSDRERPAEARAKLESTLQLLPDAGHRQLVRTELAAEAVTAGELDAAEAWLGECDAASNVLELDSAHRYARARLCIARGDMSAAYALIGATPGAIPWSRAHQLRAALLRITLLERAGDLAAARRIWIEVAVKHTPERVVQVACDEKLAPETNRDRVLWQALDARKKAQQITDAWAPLLLQTLWRIPLVAFALAFLTMIEGCATGIGPLAGTTSYLVCPALCDDCQAPSTYFSTGSDASDHAVVCDSRAHQPSRMNSSDRGAYERLFPQQAVPGGALTMAALSFILLFPLAALIAFALALRRRAKLRLEGASIRQRLELLARHVGGREALEVQFARGRSKAWRNAVGFVLATLVFSSAWLVVARLAVSSPP